MSESDGSTLLILPLSEASIEFFFANRLLGSLDYRLAFLNCFCGKVPATEAAHTSFGLDDLGTERTFLCFSRLKLFTLDILRVGFDDYRVRKSDHEQCRSVD